VIIILHGLAQMFIDYVEIKKNKVDGPDPVPTYNMFEYYFYVSTNTYHWRRHESAKRSGRALYTVYIFVFFVLATAYCGNLTSALILQNASIVRIANIDDANRLRATLCFRVGAAAITLVTSVYPSVQVVTTQNASNQEVLDMLAAGKCDGAILAFNDWQLVGQSVTNLQCNLVQTGPLVRQMSVMVPYQVSSSVELFFWRLSNSRICSQVDFSDRCTSLFGNTFSSLVQNLTDSFIIQSMWANTVANAKQTDCGALKLSTNITNTKLTFTFLSGLFIVFGIAMGILLVWHTLASAVDWRLLRAKWFPNYFPMPPSVVKVTQGKWYTIGTPRVKDKVNDADNFNKATMAANAALRAHPGGDFQHHLDLEDVDHKVEESMESTAHHHHDNKSNEDSAGTSVQISSPAISDARRKFEDAYRDLLSALSTDS
jgi:hypothetical protein